MVGFHPFAGQLVLPEFVRRVPAPAFDSMSVAERMAYLSTHPESYTLVTRSPGDGSPEDDASSVRLIELGKEALERIVALGAFDERNRESFFLYQLTKDGVSQLGVVGLIEVRDYLDGRVKRHERVARNRALHLSQHFETLGVQSSPIALGYRHDIELTGILDAYVVSHDPKLSFRSGDGLGQAIWVVDDPELCAAISRIVSTHELYIMDGHHRAAAAGLLQERSDEPIQMLGVLFDDARIHIEPFHRRVLIPERFEPEFVHERLVEALHLQSAPSVVNEQAAGHDDIGVWSMGEWWSGHLAAPDESDPVAAIDPVRLQNQIIAPILEIDPDHPDGHIGYFLDGADRNELTRSAPEREVFFVLRAVTPDQVFAVADAGLDMPPKSTYVTPKPRSGVFLRHF